MAFALEISGLSKTYANGVQALADVTLTIGPGMYGLLGPNGAGKSTLMQVGRSWSRVALLHFRTRIFTSASKILARIPVSTIIFTHSFYRAHCSRNYEPHDAHSIDFRSEPRRSGPRIVRPYGHQRVRATGVGTSRRGNDEVAPRPEDIPPVGRRNCRKVSFLPIRQLPPKVIGRLAACAFRARSGRDERSADYDEHD